MRGGPRGRRPAGHAGRWRHATRPLRALPDFLVIGAMKAGTTSLYHYLLEHPRVAGACRKEVHYFDKAVDPGVGWYRAHFPARPALWARAALGRRRVVGEASPRYLFEPGAAARAAAVVPRARILVLLRDPVDRAWSHYHHSIRLGRDTASFEDAIARELEILDGTRPAEDARTRAFRSYLRRGLYAAQLEPWLARFPRERVAILEYGRFFGDVGRGLAEVVAFLGLPPAPIEARERHLAGSYAPMPEAERARLAAFFRPHNGRLNALLAEGWGWSDPGWGAPRPGSG